MSKSFIILLSGLMSFCTLCQAAYPQRNVNSNYPAYTDRDEGITKYSNWDYQQGWRNYRDAYFRGETQDYAYRQSHPNGRGGIGYDTDYDEYNVRTDYNPRNDRLGRYDRNDPRWNDRGYPNTLSDSGSFESSDSGRDPHPYRTVGRYGNYNRSDSRWNDRGYPNSLYYNTNDEHFER